MTKRIDFEKFNLEFLAMLKKHGITPEAYAISLTLSKDDFDEVAANQPDLISHPGIILKIKGLQWSMQILRKFDLEDFPPGVVQKVPEDE
jgi:hypothetical protein